MTQALTYPRKLLLSVLIVVGSCKLGFAETTSIPLSTIITTSSQEGLIPTSSAFPRTGAGEDARVSNRFLRQILQGYKGGASNAFLVEAAIPRYAITASSKVLLRSRSADQSVSGNPKPSPTAKFWLVVYLGSSRSESAAWLVESVEVTGKRIVFAYHKDSQTTETSFAQPYYYWIPLEAIEPGYYNVELVDSASSITTLMRRIGVSTPN